MDTSPGASEESVNETRDGAQRVIDRVKAILGRDPVLRCHRDEEGRVWPPTSATLMLQFSIEELEFDLGLNVTILDADGEKLSAEAYRQLIAERNLDISNLTPAHEEIPLDPDAPVVQHPNGAGSDPAGG